MKKALLILSCIILIISLCSCKDSETPTLSAGFLCSNHMIADKANNQAVWEALSNAAELYGITTEYAYYPDIGSESVVEGFNQLYQNGCRMIFVTDYRVSASIEKLQKSYKDCKFVCIGFALSNIASNTVCLTFAEHEAAFAAAVAAAKAIQNGEISCILGMDVPSSQRYLNGLKNGIEYANRHLNTSVTFDDSTAVFIGSYNDPSLAYSVAEQMYARDIRCIFTDGQKSGDGVYAAAINARKLGISAYVIGAETDGYHKGQYQNSDLSVSLCSAIFNYNSAVCYPIERYLSGSFNGGKLISMDCASDGIALFSVSPNLGIDAVNAANKVIEKIKDKEIIVKDPASLLD